MSRNKALFLIATLALAPALPTPAQDPHHGHHQHGQPHAQEGMDMHHDFSDAERWAKIFDDPARVAWQKPEEVVALMKLRPGMVVADLGSGTGFFLGYLSTAVGEGGRVLGLEPEAKLVEYLRGRIAKAGWKNTEARQIPYDTPALADASVDRILIVDTWHHIQERGAYSKKLAATLEPGGAVYVVDFTMDSPVGPKKNHRLAPEVVVEELRQGGLAAEVLDETLPNQYIIRASRP